MDLIYTNARKEDQGVVPNFKLDLSFGYDENNFELSVSNADHICEEGSVIYMEGTEYGGIVDAIRVETENRKIVYLGNTWHGLLESKVIEPNGKHTENTASGSPIHLTDSANGKNVGFGLYGKAEQNGEPTPDYPQEITVAGESGSVEVVSCGKNLCSALEVGGINGNTGADGTAKNRLRSNYMIVEPNSNYVVSAKNNLLLCTAYFGYDKDKKYLGNVNVKNNAFVVSDKNVYYVRLQFANKSDLSASVTSDIDSIQVEKNTVATEFEDFKETKFTIPTPNGLCGIKVASGGNYTDENGQQWIADEIVKYADGSGKRIQRIRNIVDENIVLSKHSFSNDNYFVVNIKNSSEVSVRESVSTHLVYTTVDSDLKSSSCIFVVATKGNTNPIHFSVPVSIANDIDTLKTWLLDNDVKIYYTLATPIITDLSAEEIAEIEKLHTFYPITNISNDADCGMSITYMAVDKEAVNQGVTYSEGSYLSLSGDANAILGFLISRIGLSDLFQASNELSGLTISNYSMHRYVKGYTGIKKMLEKVNGKLKFTFVEGYVILSAEPLVDYSKDDEFDSDQIDFVIEKKFKPTNHMICLGKGELKDRTVIHLYTDAEGNISKTQSLFGLDERTDIYDNANVESEEELEQGGIEALQASWNEDKLQLDLDASSSYDIGDIVGARELVTGITTAKPIIQKIVTIEKDVIKITHKVGE